MADLLIVEDDADVAELLAALLAAEGHTVRVAADGRQGLAFVADRRADAVLLDVEMPQLDGPGMAHAMLVRDAGLEMIPIVLISGMHDLERVAARIGTPYFLAKPFDLPALLALLARALREARPPTPAPGVAGASS